MTFFARLGTGRRIVIQFLEYMVGGFVYFWVGYLVFAFCYTGLGWNWLAAKMVADIVGWTSNYLIQRYWAFNNPRLKNREAQTIGRFSLVTLSNLVIDYLIIWGLDSIGVSPYIGFFISAGFFTVWNYIWYRFFVFGFQKNPGGKTKGGAKEVIT
jgi:putative flippase GtrA